MVFHVAKYGFEHYVTVGQLYDNAVAGKDPQPVQAVQRAMRGQFPDLKESEVKDWVTIAKQRGHIIPRARARRT